MIEVTMYAEVSLFEGEYMETEFLVQGEPMSDGAYDHEYGTSYSEEDAVVENILWEIRGKMVDVPQWIFEDLKEQAAQKLREYEDEDEGDDYDRYEDR